VDRDAANEWARKLREKSVKDVLATLDAHVDRGDGLCAGGFHAESPERHPCNIRRHFEGVLDSMRRDT
jgi:hypothetical protein